MFATAPAAGRITGDTGGAVWGWWLGTTIRREATDADGEGSTERADRRSRADPVGCAGPRPRSLVVEVVTGFSAALWAARGLGRCRAGAGLLDGPATVVEDSVVPELSAGSAAADGMDATAMPTPKATARPPTRPT